jgi:glycosyltransferase involved in cell wall biosynthesis
MPVYNVESFVSEAIESILNQTFKAIQLIIINDGSTDQTGFIVENYAKLDNRINVIHKKNEGPSSARNLGIEKATGDYVYFIDGDDYLDPNALETIVNLIQKNAVDIICFGIKTFKEDSLVKHNLDLEKKDEYYERKYLARKEYSGIDFYEKQVEKNSLVCSPCLYITKKTLLDEKKIKFYHGILHEDELFTRLAFIHANQILFIENKFYNRRYRPNSITTIAYSDINAISLLTIAEELHIHNKALRNHLLNEDVIKFYELSLSLIEKLSVTNYTKIDDTVKRLSKSPLSTLLANYNTRLFILQCKKNNLAIQLGTKFPMLRHLITHIIFSNQ